MNSLILKTKKHSGEKNLKEGMIVKVDSTPLDKWDGRKGFICKTVRNPGDFGPTDLGNFSICFFDTNEDMRQADVGGKELRPTGKMVTSDIIHDFLKLPIRHKEFEMELKKTLQMIEKLN